MKKSMNKILCAVLAVAMLLSCMTVMVSAARQTSFSRSDFNTVLPAAGYTAEDALTSYGQWYFYKKVNGVYQPLTWNGDARFGTDELNWVSPAWIRPSAGIATVIAWKAPFDGTVTLSDADFWRNYDGDASAEMTMTITQNTTLLHTQIMDPKKVAYSYNIPNVEVKTDDVIYFELDCHNNDQGVNSYFNPTVLYTDTAAFYDRDDKFYKTQDLQDATYQSEQGYNGWRYQYKNSEENITEYTDLVWKSADQGFWRTVDSQRNCVSADWMWASWSGPTAAIWTAPYTGEVELGTNNGNMYLGTSSTSGSLTMNIYVNTPDNLKWTKTLTTANTNGSGFNINLEHVRVQVNAGDKIYHELVYSDTTSGFGTAYWGPRVTYISYANAGANKAKAYSMLKEGKMIVAQYDATKNLKKIELADLTPLATSELNSALGIDTTYASKRQPVSFDITWAEGATYYKVFTWDGFTSMKPMNDAVKYVK